VLQLNSSWLHVSAALRPSSGQLVQIKCPQCAYNMYAHCSQEPLSCSTEYCEFY